MRAPDENDLRAGKLDEELREVREIGEKVALYAQLRFHALQMQRKLGWAAYFFKGIYGHWPDRAWEKVPPMRPTENTMAMIEARDRRFVFEQQMERRKNERAAHEQRVEDGEAPEALHGGTESLGEGEDGGRVPGVEEQGDSDGELCPPVE
jgi:hypothetical protein